MMSTQMIILPSHDPEYLSHWFYWLYETRKYKFELASNGTAMIWKIMTIHSDMAEIVCMTTQMKDVTEHTHNVFFTCHRM
jgi:hypothetical protein